MIESWRDNRGASLSGVGDLYSKGKVVIGACAWELERHFYCIEFPTSWFYLAAMLSEKTGLISKPPNGKSRYVLVIHGGAGTMTRAGSTPEQQAAYKNALSKALQAGYEVLKEGGEAMDAAVAAVSSMEGSSIALTCTRIKQQT